MSVNVGPFGSLIESYTKAVDRKVDKLVRLITSTEYVHDPSSVDVDLYMDMVKTISEIKKCKQDIKQLEVHKHAVDFYTDIHMGRATLANKATGEPLDVEITHVINTDRCV